MPILPLEERVALLETEVQSLKRLLTPAAVTNQPWWEQRTGAFADTPAFDEAARLGRIYREAQHEALREAQSDDVSA